MMTPLDPGIRGMTPSQVEQVAPRLHYSWIILAVTFMAVVVTLSGLGNSPMARRYAISSRAEAEAYINHPILGRRLCKCTRLATEISGRTIDEIFGYPDNMKFSSSMTLFAHATRDNKVFTDAVEKYFLEGFDPLTLERL